MEFSIFKMKFLKFCATYENFVNHFNYQSNYFFDGTINQLFFIQRQQQKQIFE